MRTVGVMDSPTRTFDRLPSTDPRNADFPIRAILPSLAPRTRTWRYVQLDQGSEGACVGFSVTMEAAACPVPVFGDPLRHPNVAEVTAMAEWTYHRARQLDEYPGEDYEGSSVLGGMKAGVERGWYREYRWATGSPAQMADDVITAIGYHGPVVFGANWVEGMDQPDASGTMHYSGAVRGGHAFIGSAYSVKRDAVFIPNSWGGAGQGWLPRAEIAKMLADGGEACVPVSRLKPR